jgi:bile acid-coenzyme A ligase
MRLPDDVRMKYDLSSLRVMWHFAEPCPPWLKDFWIDWLGPERIVEVYGGTEAQSATIITGTEWLTHKGSVGRPFTGEILVGDDVPNELSRGTVGEVWMRRTGNKPSYQYRGAEAHRGADGWESLGDMGWMDDEGYVYLCDRRDDMILVGGSNVYPAEVEAAILENPSVRSCAVIGLPDEDRGNSIHALVEADPRVIPESDLLAYLADRLVPYKLPHSIEYVDVPLRDDSGKVRRSALRAERLKPSTS